MPTVSFGRGSRRIATIVAGLVAGVLAVSYARADAVADFYKNKQITLLVGSDPGGGYDLLARLVSRHIGRHMPGRPSVIVENMPGAGSILLSNRVYNTAPKDGTFIGLVQRGVLLAQLTKQPNVHFDLDKFNWIGSVSSEVSVVSAWHVAPVKTFKDTQERDTIVGGTGPTSDTEASARLLNAIAGTRFKIISGYPGTADVLLAMERGELEGIVDLSWGEMKSKNARLLADKKLRIIAQNTMVKSPELPDVPLVLDYLRKESDRPVAELFYAVKEVARPILSAPGIPAERVEALRNAFDTMVRDPDFLADATNNRLDLTPSGHAAVASFVHLTKTSPPEVRARLAEILNPAR
jgi:tripartite-type tricarboxylate transporter receptor subunit TctC